MYYIATWTLEARQAYAMQWKGLTAYARNMMSTFLLHFLQVTLHTPKLHEHELLIFYWPENTQPSTLIEVIYGDTRS